MSSASLEPVGDIVVWVDSTLLQPDTASLQPVSNRLGDAQLATMGSFVDESVAGQEEGIVSVPEMERRNMSLAECEQCSLDDFWGLVANQAEQAEATALMGEEDRRSHALRLALQKEERYAMWEQEDMSLREARSNMRQSLDDFARREYLESFYRTPSVDWAVDYRWPTHAVLPQPSTRHSSDPIHDAKTCPEAWSSYPSSKTGTHISGEGPAEFPTTSMQTGGQGSPSTWSMCGSSGGTSWSRPFHSFRGKKAYHMVSAQDCFVPPRHLSEPTGEPRLVSAGALRAYLPGANASYAPLNSVGPTKAVHLPPMIWAGKRARPTAPLGSDSAWGSSKGQSVVPIRPFPLKPAAPREPLLPSFERKFAVMHELWSRESEAQVEEQEAEAQRRAEDLLRESTRRHQARVDRGVRGWNAQDQGRCLPSSSASGYGQPKSSPHARRRRRRCWQDECTSEDRQFIELNPETEDALLTDIFRMLDARDRGGVRLDEALFHMTENGQVKAALKQVTLWILIKKRRWEWLEELFLAQPSRILTLSALLEFGRGLRVEARVERARLRASSVITDGDLERNDSRSKRLLPEGFFDGQEVRALFMKGFRWYRAWIVRCHPNDTFDVRYTPPPTGAGSARSWPKGPEMDASLGSSGSRASWGESGTFTSNEGQDSGMTAEEEWKASCESVARFIGIPPDLGKTELQVLEGAFAELLRLTSASTPSSHQVQRIAREESSYSTGEATISSVLGADSVHANAPQTETISSAEPGPEVVWAGDDFYAIEPRIPAEEIIRLLRQGAIDEYRRASPSLTAACLYQDFAEGLDVATRENSASWTWQGDSGDEHHAKGSEGSGRGTIRGVSKAEFCEYFEAVTDLVELNGLSLVRNDLGHGSSRRSSIETQ